MLEMFRRAGIRNYSIWQTGDTLFGYYECDDLKTALAVQRPGTFGKVPGNMIQKRQKEAAIMRPPSASQSVPF